MTYVSQVGGDHYQNDYQHWDWIIDVWIGPLEYAATKYVSRWWKKNGVEDLRKARTYVEKIIAEIGASRYQCHKHYREDRAIEATVRFCHDNELDVLESRFMAIMAFWSNVRELEDAIAVLDAIIANPQGRHNRRQWAGATGAGPQPTPPALGRLAEGLEVLVRPRGLRPARVVAVHSLDSVEVVYENTHTEVLAIDALEVPKDIIRLAMLAICDAKLENL